MELTHTAARAGRLSGFLRQDLAMSQGLINRLKRREAILVNGRPVWVDYNVVPGDRITVLLEEPAAQYPPEAGDLTILYEDDHLLAVDKPAGMLIHPSRSQLTGTLANRVLFYYRQTGQDCAFHPVTRLDRDTYGLVLLAKNSHVHAAMTALHRENRLEKTYHALVFHGPAADSGVIDAPIARLPLPSLLRQVDPRGKPARTEFRVLSRSEKGSKLALTPITGRTHQLRVHCAWMGFPILGDPQYFSPESMARSRELGLTGQALSAKSLTFPHPVTGERMVLESRMDVPDL